jgi:CBS-domain-containing membrane protein
LVHTVCTNIPGPRETRYVLGERVLEIHPIVPLAASIGLGFAIFSYDGKLSIAATADAGLVPDADRLPEALNASAEELRASLALADAPARVRAADRTTVADLMTREVTVLAARDSLAHAWEVMHQKRIRHLPVVGRHERLIGLVTQRDLLAAAQSSLSFRTEAERVRLLGLARAEDVMETHLSTARPDESAAEVGLRMVRHKIGCLPVVDDSGRLGGIITEEDFLRWATSHMEGAA